MCAHTLSYNTHLNSLLHEALKNDSSLEYIKFLTAKGANLNSFDYISGDSFLIMSVVKNRIDVVHFLLSKGVNLALKNTSSQQDALHRAVSLGRLEILEALIAAGANVNSWDGFRIPMHTAAGRSDLDALKLLIKAGGDLTRTDCDRDSAMEVIKRNRLEEPLIEYLKNHHYSQSQLRSCFCWLPSESEIQRLVSIGVDIHTKLTCEETYKNYKRYGLLHIALRRGSHLAVRLCLYGGANPNLEDDDGATPVRLAIARNDHDILNMLVAAGANLNSAPQQSTYLIYAIQKSSVEMVQALITHGADINGTDKDGDTALHVAVKDKDVDKVKLLIENGAEVDTQNAIGHTPFFLAMRARTLPLICILLECGARTDRIENFKRTVTMAKQLNDSEFVCALSTPKKTKL